VYHARARTCAKPEKKLLPAELKRFPLLCGLVALLTALMLGAGLLQAHYLFHQSVFVPLHTAMHVFSLVVSWLVFAIGWNTQDPQRAGSITLLACGFLGVALVDFGHAMSYAGMPDLITPASPEKSINFSLVSRLLAALSLLAIALMPTRPLIVPARRYGYLAAMLAVVALAYWVVLFHPQVLPTMYVAGAGLTPAKVAAEYALVLLHVVAAIGFYLQLRTAGSSNAAYLLAASVVMALSQVFIALYAHPYDIQNFLSHVYRVIGYMLIYRGIFMSEMREPYRVAERLQRELRESATRLRELSARMQQDIEEERKRISQSLHDEMGQSLTALQLDAHWIRRHCKDDPTIIGVADRMQDSIEDSAASMRRIVADMRPRVLDDLGIIAAIKGLVKDVAARTGVELAFVPRGELDDIEDAVKTALYRMLQECLTNVSRHAQAKTVDILLAASDREIEMRVVDDGCGFGPEARGKHGSFGLFGLGERAAQLGGSVTVESAPQAGTRITVRLPLQKSGAVK
jgi:signal transduction histidine kinase